MKKYIREPLPALSHLFGAVLSVLALIVFLEKSGANERAAFATAVFGVSLILLYLASALTHGVHCSPRLAACFERCDRAAIFLLIAGTYTPLCLLVIKGVGGWALLGIEWLLAFTGIYAVFAKSSVVGSARAGSVQVYTYLAMGWLFIFALDAIVSAVSNSLLAWLLGGALFYSVGTIFFLTNRPTLWRGYFEAHDLWHFFVLGGSACHYIFINRYLATI